MKRMNRERVDLGTWEDIHLDCPKVSCWHIAVRTSSRLHPVGLESDNNGISFVNTCWSILKLKIINIKFQHVWGAVVNRGDGGSIPPTAVSKLRQFHSLHICLCLSEETLNAISPFYLVSIPGEVKDPTWGSKCVTCSGLTDSRE